MLPSPVKFKDLDKMGAATIDLAHSPIDPVDKVVWEPMKALNQLCGAMGDFIMEDDSDDAPPSHNWGWLWYSGWSPRAHTLS